MAQITIKYTAATASTQNVDQICRMFIPNNAAADNAAFEGTYYDTNVDGRGVATLPEDFIKDSIAHPGVILAMKRAAETGEYVFETDDNNVIMYYEELADAVADQGFEISVAKN